jgi:prolyl-tRNA synthetase
MNMKSDAVRQAAEAVYADLEAAGVEALFDDRPERAGVKLTDAELLGIPLVLIVGDRGVGNGVCELKARATGATREVTLAEAAAAVREAVDAATDG